MKTAFTGILILGISLTLAAQDPNTKEERNDFVRKALDKSIQSGGFRYSGHVKPLCYLPPGSNRLPADDGSPAASLSGVRDNQGGLTAVLELNNGTHEIYWKGDRVIQRQVWKGNQPYLGDLPRQVWAEGRPYLGSFSAEISGALDLQRLRGLLDEAQELLALEPATVDGRECRRFQMTLDERFLKYPRDDGVRSPWAAAPIDKVELRLWIGSDDVWVRRLEVLIIRSCGGGARLQVRRGGESDDKDEKKHGEGGAGDVPPRIVTQYTLTLSEFGKGLKAEFPPELKRDLFGD